MIMKTPKRIFLTMKTVTDGIYKRHSCMAWLDEVALRQRWNDSLK